MDVIYVLVSLDEGALTLEKVTNEISVVPVFRSEASARKYIGRKINEPFRDRIEVKEFSISTFDDSHDWAKRSGITLYIRLEGED